MRTVSVNIYKASELGKMSLNKAYEAYIDFHIQDLSTRPEEENESLVIYLTFEEFIETSDNNEYEYLKDGSYINQSLWMIFDEENVTT